ncbi:MAG: hypothetical protein QM778_30170 [Myxococcales bacterium]
MKRALGACLLLVVGCASTREGKLGSDLRPDSGEALSLDAGDYDADMADDGAVDPRDAARGHVATTPDAGPLADAEIPGMPDAALGELLEECTRDAGLGATDAEPWEEQGLEPWCCLLVPSLCTP